jgi:hypothetical protein
MTNLEFLKKMKGYGILIEAGFLSLSNYIFIGHHKSIINLIISRSVTDIIAILTVLLLSLGFIYFIGYFFAARLRYSDKNLADGGTLKDNILPFGAIFLLAILFPLMWIPINTN